MNNNMNIVGGGMNLKKMVQVDYKENYLLNYLILQKKMIIYWKNGCNATPHIFLIKVRHYSIDQLNLHKVPYYLINWRLFFYNSIIYVWGGFQKKL